MNKLQEAIVKINKTREGDGSPEVSNDRKQAKILRHLVDRQEAMKKLNNPEDKASMRSSVRQTVVKDSISSAPRGKVDETKVSGEIHAKITDAYDQKDVTPEVKQVADDTKTLVSRAITEGNRAIQNRAISLKTVAAGSLAVCRSISGVEDLTVLSRVAANPPNGVFPPFNNPDPAARIADQFDVAAYEAVLRAEGIDPINLGNNDTRAAVVAGDAAREAVIQSAGAWNGELGSDDTSVVAAAKAKIVLAGAVASAVAVAAIKTGHPADLPRRGYGSW